jgi:LPS O-antigen subunit length determinant protein (WzzB/FepE family)
MTEAMDNTEEIKNNETNLLEGMKKIWAGRRTIYKSLIVFVVFGILNILFSPKVYRSDITLVVETSTGESDVSSLIQEFGGLAGINLNKNEIEALTPELYPEVIKSTPFLMELMNQKVSESKYDSIITVADYLQHHTRSSFLGIVKKYTLGLPGKIIEWVRGNPKAKPVSHSTISSVDSVFFPIKLSTEQSKIAESLAASISTQQDFKKSNKFVISVAMQDPVVVAQVTAYVVKNLTKYIIEYRTKKAKTDLKFVAARTAEAEAEYVETQQALASYKDRNKNVILSSVLTEEERLQAEYDLAFGVYSALSKQLEQSKIKVQEETPVFNVMNPAQIPLQKSKPKTSFIMFQMVFFGIFVGIGIILGKSYLKKIRKIFA